jgi:hypothetical protein
MPTVDSSRSRVIERAPLHGGVIAGFAAGLALAVYLAVTSYIGGQGVWRVTKAAAYPLIGRRALAPGFSAGPVLLGLVCHFAVSVLWGVLFAALFFGLSQRATVIAGAIWGLVAWLAMYYVVLPLVGAGMLNKGPVVPAILAHLLFGLALGICFLPFQRQRAVTPRVRRREPT